MDTVKEFSFEDTELGGGEGGALHREFRDALGCFATGVAVITTVSKGNRPVGITVNSFASVSLEPPLILWSLSRASGLVRHFTRGTPFAVNILAEDQEEMARKFSRAGGDPFEGVDAESGRNRAPLLRGNAGFLECQVTETVAGGDHVIVLGRVGRFACGLRRPLLFYRGEFTKLTQDRGG